MSSRIDLRVPLLFGAAEDAAAGDALLIENEGVAPGHFLPAPLEFHSRHSPSCPCCQARNAAGRALASLLQARARGEVAFFRRVVAVTRTPAGRLEVEEAVRFDPVASACYRLSAAAAFAGCRDRPGPADAA